MRKHWASQWRRRLTVFIDGAADAEIVETNSTERYAAGG
jgi:hypothetical protein